MSLTFTSRATRDELVEFLESEYRIDSGIPAHLYSVVNSMMGIYDRVLAITDNDRGTIFLEEPRSFKSYGNGNPLALMRTLNQCAVGLRIV